MRAVPTASNGFIAATSAEPGRRRHPAQPRARAISPSDITVSSTLSVSSGTRLSSST